MNPDIEHIDFLFKLLFELFVPVPSRVDRLDDLVLHAWDVWELGDMSQVEVDEEEEWHRKKEVEDTFEVQSCEDAQLVGENGKSHHLDLAEKNFLVWGGEFTLDIFKLIIIKEYQKSFSVQRSVRWAC